MKCAICLYQRGYDIPINDAETQVGGTAVCYLVAHVETAFNLNRYGTEA